MLTAKQLAYMLATTYTVILYRARAGQIPGATKTGTGRRTRWSFPDAAAAELPPAPRREEPGRLKTQCGHCGETFTTAKTYALHRKRVTLNDRPHTVCMVDLEMRARGLAKNQRGEWRRVPPGALPLPSKPPHHTEAE